MQGARLLGTVRVALSASPFKAHTLEDLCPDGETQVRGVRSLDADLCGHLMKQHLCSNQAGVCQVDPTIGYMCISWTNRHLNMS